MINIYEEGESSVLCNRRIFLVPASAWLHLRSFGTKRIGLTCSLKG